MKEVKESHPFNKLAKPAQRALANVGIKSLEDLARLPEKEVLQLHGVGKNAVQILKTAMEEKRLSFAK